MSEPEGVFDRETMRARIENRMKDAEDFKARGARALEKLDAGAPISEVFQELGGGRGPGMGPGVAPGPGSGLAGDVTGGRGRPGERLERLRDRMGEGGGGPGFREGQPLNPEEREKLFAFLRERLPDVADRIETWRRVDPEALEMFLTRMAPRLREAGASARRDPDGAAIRLRELEGSLDVLDATQAMRVLFAAGGEPDAAKLGEARAKLRAGLERQLAARMEFTAHQIGQLEAQVADLRAQLASGDDGRKGKVEERAAAFEASIRDRATRAGEKREPRRERGPKETPKDAPGGG